MAGHLLKEEKHMNSEGYLDLLTRGHRPTLNDNLDLLLRILGSQSAARRVRP